MRSIRRLFRTESHGMKRKRVPGSRPRTRPSSAFLRSIYAGRVRWRTREQVGILRAPGGEVADVSSDLMLAVTSGCALIPAWDPRDPPPEVVACLTREGEEVVIEAARRRARQRKAKR